MFVGTAPAAPLYVMHTEQPFTLMALYTLGMSPFSACGQSMLAHIPERYQTVNFKIGHPSI